MADRGDANGLLAVGDLVDDSVGADAERSEALESAAERISGEGLPFVDAEGVLDGVDQRPAEFEQLLAGASREDDSGHSSAGFAELG